MIQVQPMVYLICWLFVDEDTRRPGQRPTTAMLGNEVMNKEQLYDLFQQILGVKKFEHQLLYNAMQVSQSKRIDIFCIGSEILLIGTEAKFWPFVDAHSSYFILFTAVRRS